MIDKYFTYYATVVEHKDGDTTVFHLDLGLRVEFEDEFRWIGVDAPEKWTELGKISKAALEGLIPVGTRVKLYTFKDGKKPRDKKDKYGRWLVEVWTVLPDDSEHVNVNEWLVDSGYAREYHGEKRTWLAKLFR